jgi:hypothetical protein
MLLISGCDNLPHFTGILVGIGLFTSPESGVAAFRNMPAVRRRWDLRWRHDGKGRVGWGSAKTRFMPCFSVKLPYGIEVHRTHRKEEVAT